jgi:tRNA(adenine34) deaminase
MIRRKPTPPRRQPRDPTSAFETVSAISSTWSEPLSNPASPTTSEHERYMRRCLELAAVARERGDVPVGAVVVIDGAIAGEASETLPTGAAITGHAETLACQAALDAVGGRDLAGATLYTTAEPCFMCSFLIRRLRAALVVYGVETPMIGGATSAHPILTDPALDPWRPAPRVAAGVLRDECERIGTR